MERMQPMSEKRPLLCSFMTYWRMRMAISRDQSHSEPCLPTMILKPSYGPPADEQVHVVLLWVDPQHLLRRLVVQ